MKNVNKTYCENLLILLDLYSGVLPTYLVLNSSGLISPHSKLFLEIMDVVSSGLKRKMTIQIVIAFISS